MCVCVCVTNTNTTKKGLFNKSILCLLTKYFYCLFLFCGLTKFLCSKLEKVSPKNITKRMVASRIDFHGGWRLEVKCKKRKSVLTVSQNWGSESVFFWKSHWKECVDPVSENVKEGECWKTRVFIDCYEIAEGFRFMPLSLVRLRTFRLSTWVVRLK